MNAYEYPHDWKIPVRAPATSLPPTLTKMEQVAKKWNVELATIQAVAEVESSGSGFLSSGEPRILFEPHIFWRQLEKRGINPNTTLKTNPKLASVLYKNQGTKAYGTQAQQHRRLDLAASYHRDAALESASWGKYQVLGNNWKDLGYPSIQAFINDAYESDDSQFELFVRYVEVNDLVKYLKKLDFANFAKRYNGPNYKKFKYDTKMLTAYKKFKAINA